MRRMRAQQRIFAFGMVAMVALQASASAAQQVSAARDLPAGHVLARADMVFGGADTAASGEAALAPFVGQALRAATPKGRLLKPNQLREPLAVERNAIVTLVFRRGGLEMRTEARALGDATAGEPVRVLNTDSRQSVEGRAIAPGLVEVGR